MNPAPTPFSGSSVVCRFRVLGLLLVGAALALPVGCRKSPPEAAPTWVAMVGTTPIEPAQVLQAWERRQRGVATNLPPSVVLADLVDEAATFEQARRVGFLDRPEMRAAMRQFIATKYREAQQTNNPTSTEPSDRELRELYASRTNSFVRPLALNVAVILHEVPKTATPEKREEARETVARWRAEIVAGPDPAKAFRAMTAQRSADSLTRYRRGEVGWLSLSELSQRLTPEVVTAVTEMEAGAISKPIDGPKGIYLIQLIGRRAAEVRPYAELEPTLRYQLGEAKRRAAEDQFRTAQRRGLEIRTNMALLNSISRTNRPPSPPPAMPKG